MLITCFKMEELSLKPHWTMEHIGKFINLYRQHECLWNPEVESYKNFPLKKSALHKLVADMRMPGLTPNIAKDRIKSIRTMYRRELNKVVKSATSNTNNKYVYKPKLFWFDQIDSFLRPVAISRMDATSLGCTSFETSHNNEGNEDSDENFCLQEQKVENELTEENSLSLIEEPRPKFRNSFSEEQQPRKKQKTSVNDFYTFSDDQRNSSNNHNLEENEFDIFGKFISAQLKKLPIITALQCQQKIQDFLTSKRIEILEYQNRCNADRIDISGPISPFSNCIDMYHEEKPNIHKDTFEQEKGN